MYSNFCLQCTKLENKLVQKKITKKVYEDRKAKHENKCAKNYDGKSGEMEVDAAVQIWKRSEEKLKFRYVSFIGDGDTSAYKAIEALNEGRGPYTRPGPLGTKVVKLECVNHVGKRLGTRLRKLKQHYFEMKANVKGKQYKKSLFGGAGKLTDYVITHLTKYYTNAIYRNTNKSVSDLRRDIMASFLHTSSTDENPQHDLCPKGSDSWCFFQKARALGGPPNTHNKMKVHFTLNRQERQIVFGVYKDLSNDDLLRRCLGGHTQNSNEALHSKIWNTLSKNKFFGLKTVRYGIAHTVLVHNMGYAGGSVVSRLGFTNGGGEYRKNLETKDKKRRRSCLQVKPRKKKKTVADPVYKPGAY